MYKRACVVVEWHSEAWKWNRDSSLLRLISHLVRIITRFKDPTGAYTFIAFVREWKITRFLLHEMKTRLQYECRVSFAKNTAATGWFIFYSWDAQPVQFPSDFSRAALLFRSRGSFPWKGMAILRPVVMFRDNDVTLVLHRCFRGPDFPLFHKSNRIAPGENWENGFDGFNGFNGFGKKHFLCYIWGKVLSIKKCIWRESAKNFTLTINFSNWYKS